MANGANGSARSMLLEPCAGFCTPQLVHVVGGNQCKASVVAYCYGSYATTALPLRLLRFRTGEVPEFYVMLAVARRDHAAVACERQA